MSISLGGTMLLGGVPVSISYGGSLIILIMGWPFLGDNLLLGCAFLFWGVVPAMPPHRVQMSRDQLVTYKINGQ